MGDLSLAFLKQVGDYMLVETPLAKADACILFGGNYPEARANVAADLYHKGYFDIIVSTGGVMTHAGQIESRHMRDILVARGVPEDKIICEDNARNTAENVLFSKALLGDVKTVIGVGGIHAARRFLMTLERHWPEPLKMFAPANPYGVAREDWHTHAEFRQDVLAEHAKIAPYKAADMIREIDVDDLGRRIIAHTAAPAFRKTG